MTNVAAILLAAGLSRRMGAFKPLLPFGNKTVIEHAIDYIRTGGVETIVVVLGHNATDVRARLSGQPLLFAVNPDPESEMSSSIACGVMRLPETVSAVLITPADLPAIPAHVVATLVAEWQQGERLVVPVWNDRGGHPVLVDLAFRRELLTLDASIGLRSLFDAHRSEVKRVKVDSPYIARDMDTWDDYRALHEEVFGELPPRDSALDGRQ